MRRMFCALSRRYGCKRADKGTGNDAVMPETDAIPAWQAEDLETRCSGQRGLKMKKIWTFIMSAGLLSLLFLTGCSQTGQPDPEQDSIPLQQETDTPVTEADTEEAMVVTETETKDELSEPGHAALLYLGQASLRIVTDGGKVIYIDPYAGDAYDLPADLILVTHSHFDHSQTDKVEYRNEGCQIITQKEAVLNGEHQIFDLGYVMVEAVEAGYNPLHDVNECVGYVLTFSNGKSVYVTGDTSATEQMPLLAEKEIDYAFFCCDGVYNMGLEEAAEFAEMVGAKHNIPYHMTTTTAGRPFDRELAEQFDVENRLIIEDGEEIMVE